MNLEINVALYASVISISIAVPTFFAVLRLTKRLTDLIVCLNGLLDDKPQSDAPARQAHD